MRPRLLISHNMHSTVDKIAPHPLFETCWLSSLCLIFTYGGITSYHRERKIWHRQVGPTLYVSFIPKMYSSTCPISRVRSMQHFLWGSGINVKMHRPLFFHLCAGMLSLLFLNHPVARVVECNMIHFYTTPWSHLLENFKGSVWLETPKKKSSA